MKCPFNSRKILADIDQAIINSAEKDDRTYLGMSGIGGGCPRKIWMNWRWFGKEKFSPRMLRLFDRGHREEERIFLWLTQAGYTVVPFDKNGKQFEVVAEEGHAKGHFDGFIIKKKVKAILECKTHNQKNFSQLVRQKSIEKSHPAHYFQCQRYMHAEKLKWAVYFGVCKNTDALYIEVVPYDKQAAAFLVEREGDLVWRESPPRRISEDPDYYRCRMCHHKGVCFGSFVPPTNCRTCRYVKPFTKGRWVCRRKEKNLSVRKQRKGCKSWRPLKVV